MEEKRSKGFGWLHISDLHFKNVEEIRHEESKSKESRSKEIRWLHISDLHFGNPNRSFTDTRKKLLEFIKEGKIDTVDYLFITGDIIYAGRNASGSPRSRYDSAKKYIGDLVKILWETVSEEALKEKIFIVPGNHDLLRETDKFSRTAIMEDLKKQNKEGAPSEERHRMNTWDAMKKSGFIEFYKNYVSKDDLKKFKDEVHFCKELENVIILHINSAFSSCKESEDGSLILDSNLLRNALEPYKDTKKPIIALSHHVMKCFSDTEQDTAELILKDYGALLYLCGHVHVRASEVIRMADQLTPLSCFSCGTLLPESRNEKMSTTAFWGKMDCDEKEGKIVSYICECRHERVNDGKWEKDSRFGSPQEHDGENYRTFTYKKDRVEPDKKDAVGPDGEDRIGSGSVITTKSSNTRDNLFKEVNNPERIKSISIYGARLTNITKQNLIETLIKEGKSVKLCMSNPFIIKNRVETIGQTEGICPMGNESICEFCRTILEDEERYISDWENSYKRAQTLNGRLKQSSYKGNLDIQISELFFPLSINIINKDENDAIAILEQYIPYSTKKNITTFEKQRDPDSFQAVVDLFNKIWQKSKPIQEGEK